jgi:PAS domain S-box-containing protein
MTAKLLEREVLDAKRRLEGIVASAMDAIITIDERQQIILFNPAAEQMFGVTSADAMGQHISRFIPHRFRAGHDEHIERFRKTGVTGRRMGALGAISGLRADGEEFPVEASISQVEVEGDRLATVILRDITERIANEEARLLLAREVDHRAKNALAVVQALVSMTTAPTKDDFITAVRGRVGALGRAHSLLAQNRWQGGDLGKIVTDETAAYHKPGQLRTHGPKVVLTPNAVQPVSLLIHELATNAVKHGALSSPSGKIDVHWRLARDGDLEIIWVESGGPTVVQGSPEGFGTTLMSTVSRQLGGEVTTQWTPEGIRVTAQLPAANYRAEVISGSAAAEAGGAAMGAVPRAGRLLVVEDELLVGMELANALRDEGWEVVGPAGTLEEALEMLAGDVLPDAAILDINLNGQLVYPVADLLRVRGIPYLFCTGYESPDEDERYRHSPIVQKPTNLRVLIEEVRKLIGGDHPQPGTREAA